MNLAPLSIAACLSAVACAASFSPAPTPAMIASMPDTIPCDKAVKVEAGHESSGIRAERRWLDAFYPKHSAYSQALHADGGRRYDILSFERADGRAATVCFDITDFFGHW